jgi:aspartate carbamoyltransferase catalytic subunit
LSIGSQIKMIQVAQKALAKAHVLNVKQFTREMLHGLYGLADKFKLEPNTGLLKGKVMASIFYEPSTRTSCSFSSAMQRLGGSVIPIHQIGSTSLSKGESLHDFVRTMECYADVIVLRHPDEGSVAEAAG